MLRHSSYEVWRPVFLLIPSSHNFKEYKKERETVGDLRIDTVEDQWMASQPPWHSVFSNVRSNLPNVSMSLLSRSLLIV